jgi:import inner membrane translocase subunit TIM22
MDFKRITGMAKGFGIFGFFFSLFECQIERLRARDDSLNSFYSGMFTTMIITSEGTIY